MQPSPILSSHLPATGGERVGRFLDVLGTLPDAGPFVAPDSEAFGHMVAAMGALVGEG